MKRLVFLVTLAALWTVPSVAFALADACFENEYAALPTTGCTDPGVVCQSEVSTYYQYLSDNPLILESMDYCDDVTPANFELSQLVRDALWQKYEYAQANPSLGTLPVPNPAFYDTMPNRWTCCLSLDDYADFYIAYTQAELIDTYTSRVAHAIWLDVTNKYPWKLSEYTELQLRYMFDLYYLFNQAWSDFTWAHGDYGQANFDAPIGGGGPYATYYATEFQAADPSPRDAWLIMDALVAGAHSPRTAVERLFTGFYSRHVSAGGECHGTAWQDARTAVSVKDWFDVRNTQYEQANALGQPNCFEGIDSAHIPIGRSGCNDRTKIFQSGLRAVNIPATFRMGLESTTTGHGALLIPTLDMVMYHADDAVNYGLTLNISYGLHPYEETISLELHPANCIEAMNVPPPSYERGIRDGRNRCLESMHWQRDSGLTRTFCGLGFNEVRLNCNSLFNACEESHFTQWKADLAALTGCTGD